MTEQSEDRPLATESPPGEDARGVEPGVEQDGRDRDAEPARPARSGGGVVAWLALLLALALIGVAAWVVLGPGSRWLPTADLERRQAASAQRLSELDQRLDALAAERLDGVETAVASLREQLGGIDDDLVALRRELDAVPAAFDPQPLQRRLDRLSARLEREIPALRQRLTALESRLDAAVETGAPRRVAQRAALLDAIAYLREARVRFEVSQRPEPALAGFRQARTILRQLNLSGLEPVVAALHAELEQLSRVAARRPDTAVAELGTLAGAAADWPLAGTAGPERQAAAADSERGNGAGQKVAPTGWWQRLSGLLGDMVRVRRAGDMPVTVDEAHGLRRQVATQLTSAQLLLLQGRYPAYRQLLDTIIGTLEQWFDTAEPTVASALASLRQLHEAAAAPEPPSLGAAETRLRELLETLRGEAGESQSSRRPGPGQAGTASQRDAN